MLRVAHLAGIGLILHLSFFSDIRLSVAQGAAPSADQVPGALVTAETKQVYRFHFSALQGDDAIRLAQQLWPVVSKLPAENPLRRTLADAKDRKEFVDDFRSLRASFLDAGIDTVYFLADAYWIESTTLPGRVALPGSVATRDRLEKRLRGAGHEVWADTVNRLQTTRQAPGWLVADLGSRGSSNLSPDKRAIVEHAFQESCPIQPASVHLGSLPALRMSLNQATPVTVVNLERSTLDTVLTQVLEALVPSSAETAKLSERVQATTVAASIYPMVHVRQVAHLKTAGEAVALAAELQRQINGAVQKVVDLDEDLGPLLGLFARSMALVSTQGSDVHLVMKPPALFDLSQAQSKAVESLDQDWTALPAPKGYCWEIIGSLGATDRRDVFARVHQVRVRGTSEGIAPVDSSAPTLRFAIPLADSGLELFRNLQGKLRVNVAAGQKPPASLPSLELLDDQGRVAALLRLDLTSGDPRYDLARTRGVLAKRIAERTESEKKARKVADDAANDEQLGQLKGESRFDIAASQEANLQRFAVRQSLARAVAARMIAQQLDDEAREAQRLHPGATLAKETGASAGADGAWAVDRQKFPFAGQWLFDHGLLTLYQDASGAVAGVFASSVRQGPGNTESNPASGSAVLVGKARGSTLPFTMYDHRSRQWTGKLVLNGDGASGTWNLDAPEVDPPPRPVAKGSGPGRDLSTSKTTAKTPPKAAGTNGRKKTGEPPRSPFVIPPAESKPFPIIPPLGGNADRSKPSGNNPLANRSLTPIQRREMEEPRKGPLDRIDVAAPDKLCLQAAPTGSFAGYWVHNANKQMNILFEAETNGLLLGKQGSLFSPKGNLRGAGAGNLLLILEHVNVDAMLTPSVRGALLSPDGNTLSFLAESPRAPSSRAMNRTGRPQLELTRGNANAD